MPTAVVTELTYVGVHWTPKRGEGYHAVLFPDFAGVATGDRTKESAINLAKDLVVFSYGNMDRLPDPLFRREYVDPENQEGRSSYAKALGVLRLMQKDSGQIGEPVYITIRPKDFEEKD